MSVIYLHVCIHNEDFYSWMTFMDDTSIHGWGFSIHERHSRMTLSSMDDIHRWHFHPWITCLYGWLPLMTLSSMDEVQGWHTWTTLSKFSVPLCYSKGEQFSSKNMMDKNIIHEWRKLIHRKSVIHRWKCHPWMKTMDDRHGRHL